MKLACVLDIEGVVVSPGIDFAHFLLEYLSALKPELEHEVKTRVRVYDEYDDLRWASEYIHSGYSTYQTGTTPFYVLCLCAGYGLTERDIVDAAQVLAESCQRHGLMADLDKLFSMYDIVYLASSSYHAFALKVAEYVRISREHVIALGLANTREPEYIVERLLDCASRADIANMCMLLYYLARYFITRGYDPKLHRELLSRYVSSLRNRELAQYMQEKIIDQVNISGSRTKARLVEKLRQEGYTVIFVGDSIVDVEAALRANISIAVNPSSSFLAHAATFTVITDNSSGVIELLEHIASTGDVNALKRVSGQVGIEIYSKSEVSRNFLSVIARACEARSKVKSLSSRAVESALSRLMTSRLDSR